ncbi:MAG TPA: nuclear transport factor 2 family protein [Dactylosporangium sp.]|jgi:ketosteroid isomerase-like protein|nr:nuclear transport factor 2 family protein [Dactylosporangium sp.]
MTDMQALSDRVEIAALPGEFTDAASVRDYDRFVALFTEDGIWRIPGAGVDFHGRPEIRAGIERLQSAWEFFIQNVHPGSISITGDTATARVYVSELGRFRTGDFHANYSVYHDRYRRTDAGWRFAERSYEVKYQSDRP